MKKPQAAQGIVKVFAGHGAEKGRDSAMNTFEGSRECGGVMVSKERDDTSILNYLILKL